LWVRCQRMSASPGPTGPFFEDVLSTPLGELSVARWDWGWDVADGPRHERSRYLGDAVERLIGRPLDHSSVRALLDMLDRELAAEARLRRGDAASPSA
jgi:hypothetical protein